MGDPGAEAPDGASSPKRPARKRRSAAADPDASSVVAAMEMAGDMAEQSDHGRALEDDRAPTGPVSLVTPTAAAWAASNLGLAAAAPTLSDPRPSTLSDPRPTMLDEPRPPEPAVAGPTRELALLLIEDVPQVADRVRELLRSQSAYRLVSVVSDGRRAEEAVEEHRPDVVLVDTLLQGRVKGPAVIERLRRSRNPLPCVALAIPDRPLERPTRESVDAVLELPFGTFDLVRAIRAAVEAGAARNPTLASRVVAVFSAKGGVGKTTISLNLAVALQEAGLRTALVDGSLQFADIRRMLGAPDHLPSIIDMPTDSVRASDLGEVMVPGPAGVDVLLAPPRLEQGELVSTRDLDKILDMLRRSYHAVVIDTPSSLGETTLAMLDAADVIIQVVTPETAALDITRLASEAFAGIGYPRSKLQLLLNRADAQGPVTPTQVHGMFGRDPDHVVTSDWALVARSNAQGMPFVMVDPMARVSGDLRRVAERVGVVVGAQPRTSSEGLRRRGRG
jgi:pilus assembly protein CpaE